MNEKNMWIDIITKLYKNLHTSDRVMYSSKDSDTKRDRILNYFDRLERVHQKVSQSKNKDDLKRLEKFYHNLYVIKPENIPNSYFEHEKQIMRERGYGNIEITSERKEILVKQIIEDQEESLDKWIEYFLFDEESKNYEIWEKYWVFQGLQQLGKFNKETLFDKEYVKIKKDTFDSMNKVISESKKIMEIQPALKKVYNEVDTYTQSYQYLQKENDNIKKGVKYLRNRNEKLKQENKKLISYLKAIFKAIKQFFRHLLIIGNKEVQKVTNEEIKDYYDNKDFDSNDIYDIAKDTDSEKELFDYADISYYNQMNMEYDKDDFSL